MLEDFGVNIEDHQLAIAMDLPYIFMFDEPKQRYASGSMLQDEQYFNYALESWGLRLIGAGVDRATLPSYLASLTHKAMVGICTARGTKHAVVYLGEENGCYIFLNNRRQDSDEPEAYRFSTDELKERVDERVIVGSLKRCPGKFDWRQEEKLQNSLVVLERFRRDATTFCRQVQDVDSLKIAMDSYFRAFFLAVPAMMVIIGKSDLSDLLVDLRTDYLRAMKSNRPLRLSEHISLAELSEAIDRYAKVVKGRLAVQS